MAKYIETMFIPHRDGCPCGWLIEDDDPCGRNCGRIATWEKTFWADGVDNRGKRTRVGVKIFFCDECMKRGAEGYEFRVKELPDPPSSSR